MRADAPGRDEPHLRERAGKRLEHLETARRLCGEEFDDFQPHLRRHTHLGGIGAAGGDGDAVLDAIADHFGVKAGRNDIFRARLHRALDLLHGDDRTGAHQHIRQRLCDRRDCAIRSRGAESDLRHGDTALFQRRRKIDRLVGVVELDDRHKADLTDLFQNSMHTNAALPIVSPIIRQFSPLVNAASPLHEMEK